MWEDSPESDAGYLYLVLLPLFTCKCVAKLEHGQLILLLRSSTQLKMYSAVVTLPL